MVELWSIWVCWIWMIINVNIYYGFSLLHTFALVIRPWMSTYIQKTDGVYIMTSKIFKAQRFVYLDVHHVMVELWSIWVCWIDQVFVMELSVVIFFVVHTVVLRRFCLHVVYILIIEIASQTRCSVMWYINVIFIEFIKVTTYEIVLIVKSFQGSTF
jgi:hypothetical protein